MLVQMLFRSHAEVFESRSGPGGLNAWAGPGHSCGMQSKESQASSMSSAGKLPGGPLGCGARVRQADVPFILRLFSRISISKIYRGATPGSSLEFNESVMFSI